MKRQTWIIIFVIIILIIIFLLWLAFRPEKSGEKCPDGTPIPKDGKCPPSTSTGTDETGCIQPSEYQFWSYPTRLGMKDSQFKRVSELQAKLNLRCLAGLRVDGYFGCKTQKAVKDCLGVTSVDEFNSIWDIPTPILG